MNKKMLLFICSIIFLFCVSSVVASDVDDDLSLDESDSFEVDDLSVSSGVDFEESQGSDYLTDVVSDSDGSDKNQLQESVEENNDYIIVVPDTIIDRDADVLSLELPKTANGVLSVQIGKYDKENIINWVVDKEIPLENGMANYSFKGMAFGNYNVTAKYVGDDFNVPKFSKNITVNPEVSFPTKMILGDHQFITVNIPGAEGHMEYFEIVIDDLFDDEVMCEVTLKNGTGRIPLKQLYLGLQWFPFYIVLEGDNFPSYYYYDVWINVEDPILKPVSTSVYYTSIYKVQITGIDKDLIVVGDNVTFKIGSKIIGTGKIDKNGYASIKLNLKPGSYKIRTEYKKASLTKKVTVKHIVKLKTVKIKKSAKKLVLQATVKVGKKAITKKKVTFKFNGKKYTVKTNKKGVAKVTISKKVLKKLKWGKKVKYQATYLKDTVKKTAKVKW